MFERYTENARRVIFCARYEASQFGAPYIEPEHLRLGLLRENRALIHHISLPIAYESAHKRLKTVASGGQESCNLRRPASQQRRQARFGLCG